MARRQSAFTELLDFSSKLPWQVGIGLAVASALGFHFAAVAFSGVPKVTTTADLGSNVVQQGIHTFAYLLQFIVPVIFVIGATVSALKRLHSGALVDAARANPKFAIASMSWRDFERLVGEAFRRQGFTVTGFGGNGPDGGVDLGLSKNGQRFLVQCKHWRKRQVGVTVVRELNGVIAAQRAHGGFVVTGGHFTREAREFADSCAIKLIDGPALDELMGDNPLVHSAPLCPRCGTSMVERKAKQGRFAGQVFWGCQHYPKCTEILKIA
ncbi:MAG TPA: restriction endonuclease [Steroidobacteraceae bacterium]|nr:restriction endonuclease [Steroidobacteraceae bacterium]